MNFAFTSSLVDKHILVRLTYTHANRQKEVWACLQRPGTHTKEASTGSNVKQERGENETDHFHWMVYRAWDYRETIRDRFGTLNSQHTHSQDYDYVFHLPSPITSVIPKRSFRFIRQGVIEAANVLSGVNPQAGEDSSFNTINALILSLSVVLELSHWWGTWKTLDGSERGQEGQDYRRSLSLGGDGTLKGVNGLDHSLAIRVALTYTFHQQVAVVL